MPIFSIHLEKSFLPSDGPVIYNFNLGVCWLGVREINVLVYIFINKFFELNIYLLTGNGGNYEYFNS